MPTKKIDARVKNEREVLEAIKEWNRCHKYGPSFRDLVDLTDISLGTVHGVCRDLREKGKIEYTDGVSRSIKVTWK